MHAATRGPGFQHGEHVDVAAGEIVLQSHFGFIIEAFVTIASGNNEAISD